MARKKTNILDLDKDLLKKKVKEKFGRELIKSVECELLSKEIFAITKKSIGSNTLRRFFGFLDHDFSTSLNTLNTLSEYIDYDNWHSFIHTTLPHYKSLSLDDEANIYRQFYSIEIREENDMNYHNICRNAAFRILLNEDLFLKMALTLAKNKVSQIYFYERFPFIDGLCKFYKKGIVLYLQNTTNDNASLFGNSLLFLSAFLSKNIKDLHKYIFKIEEITITEQMHPFLIARSIGSKILYTTIQNGDFKSLLEEVHKWNIFFLRKERIDFWHYPYFQKMICDYLNLAGLFDESSSILKKIPANKKEYEIEDGYGESLKVVEKIAFHKKSEETFKQWFEETHLHKNKDFIKSKINPLFKKYFELQACSIYFSIVKTPAKKIKIKTRIETLIDETGFTFFQVS